MKSAPLAVDCLDNTNIVHVNGLSLGDVVSNHRREGSEDSLNILLGQAGIFGNVADQFNRMDLSL